MKVNDLTEFENEKVFNKFDSDKDDLLGEEEIQLAILYKYGLDIEEYNLRRIYYTNINKIYLSENQDKEITCDFNEFCDITYIIEKGFLINNYEKIVSDYVNSFNTKQKKSFSEQKISFDEYYNEIINSLPHASSMTIASTYSFYTSKNDTDEITVESLKNKATEVFFSTN
jgi:hypothetical protein